MIGVKAPAVALITEKETLTLGTACAEAFVTVAVTVAVPPEAMLDAESVTWSVVTAPVEAAGELTGGTLHPPKMTAREMMTSIV